jgi:hypothetical protein
VKEPKGKRRISRAAAIAGASNLADWREKHDTRARALEQEISAFREKLLAECGSNRSATRVALAEACVVTYASIQRLLHSVINGPRNKQLDVAEKVSWLTSNQARLCKQLNQLNLASRPKPRTLQEVLARNAEETARNQASNGPVSRETGQKGIESGGRSA